MPGGGESAFGQMSTTLSIWSKANFPFHQPGLFIGFWAVSSQTPYTYLSVILSDPPPTKEFHLLIPKACSIFSSVQFSSVAQSCPTLCNPMNRSTPGLPVHHQLPDITQTHVHRVSDAILPSHPLSSPSPPAPNPSQHQGLFQWLNSLHEVAKVLEFQCQHQSFQLIPRTDLL